MTIILSYATFGNPRPLINSLLKPPGLRPRTAGPGSSNPSSVAAKANDTKRRSGSCPVGRLLCEPQQWLLFMSASRRLASTRLNGFLRQLGIFMASFDWMLFGVGDRGVSRRKGGHNTLQMLELQHKRRRPCLAPRRTLFGRIGNDLERLKLSLRSRNLFKSFSALFFSQWDFDWSCLEFLPTAGVQQKEFGNNASHFIFPFPFLSLKN